MTNNLTASDYRRAGAEVRHAWRQWKGATPMENHLIVPFVAGYNAAVSEKIWLVSISTYREDFISSKFAVSADDIKSIIRERHMDLYYDIPELDQISVDFENRRATFTVDGDEHTYYLHDFKRKRA